MIDDELDELCPVCGGDGGGDDLRGQWHPCARCQGSGYLDDERLLDVIAELES